MDEGAGGGGSSKKAPHAPTMAQLPPDVHQQVMGFLSGIDRESFRRLSKGVRSGVLSSMHTVELLLHASLCGRGPQALIRLLQQTKELQRLIVGTNSFAISEAGRLLVAAIGEGRVGGKLRCLELPDLDGPYLDGLISHLRDGQLPYLQELQVSNRIYKDGNRSAAIGEMLETREQLRCKEEEAGEGSNSNPAEQKWPPLKRIEGVGELKPDPLRRIWACCSPSKVAHLEAFGGPQLAALGEYLQQHNNFSALRTLDLGAWEDWLDMIPRQEEGYAAIDFSGIVNALARGHAPGLEGLELHDWSSRMGSVGPLVTAIGPQLGRLALVDCTLQLEDFCGLVDWLGQINGLQTLFLHKMGLGEAEINHLAGALSSGRGLARLESVDLSSIVGPAPNLDPILHALAAGAPCVLTLKDIRLRNCDVTEDSLRAFIQGLGKNRFPVLERLELESDSLAAGVVHEFVDALVTLAAQQTPARLVHLELKGSLGLEEGMRELARAFQADALPYLKTLSLTLPCSFNQGADRIFETWEDLGSKIKVERLGLSGGMPSFVVPRYLTALANPGFCPSLWAAYTIPGNLSRRDVEASLEARRQEWERARGTDAVVAELRAENAVQRAEMTALWTRLRALELIIGQQQQQQQQHEQEGGGD